MKKTLYIILFLLIILLGTLLYSRFIGTIGLKTNDITVYTNIVESYDGLKIVHFSDLHYKKVITEQRIKDLIKEINRLKPDLVLFTGDILDNDYDITNQDINFLIDELAKIESTYGNYAILGDCDSRQEEVIQNIYIQSNFTLLKNSYTIIHNEKNDQIFIGGLESYNQKKADISKVMEYFKEHEEIDYKIMLIHEPDYIDTILEQCPGCSLIVSGHSLNGSVNVPFLKKILLPIGAKKYDELYYKINNTDIFISNGIGVDSINFRLFNTPSINFYRIKKTFY